MSDIAEFELYVDDELAASTYGPRDQALAEMRRYLVQYAGDGDCLVWEVTRKQIDLASPNTNPVQE